MPKYSWTLEELQTIPSIIIRQKRRNITELECKFYAGTNVDEAKIMMKNSGMKIMSIDNLDEAAMIVARMSMIVGLSKEANLDVEFNIVKH